MPREIAKNNQKISKQAFGATTLKHIQRVCNARSHPFVVSSGTRWPFLSHCRSSWLGWAYLPHFSNLSFWSVIFVLGEKNVFSNKCLCDISSTVSSCTHQDSEYKFDNFGYCDNLRAAMGSEATLSQQCGTARVNSCRQNASAALWKMKSSFNSVHVFRRRNYLFLHPLQLLSSICYRAHCIPTIKKTCMLFTIISHSWGFLLICLLQLT